MAVAHGRGPRGTRLPPQPAGVRMSGPVRCKRCWCRTACRGRPDATSRDDQTFCPDAWDRHYEEVEAAPALLRDVELNEEPEDVFGLEPGELTD